MHVVRFLFVDEQVAIDTRHFAHEVERLARLVEVRVLRRNLLVLDLVEVCVDDVIYLEHEVILVVLRVQLEERSLCFLVAAEQQRAAQQQCLPDDFRVVLD